MKSLLRIFSRSDAAESADTPLEPAIADNGMAVQVDRPIGGASEDLFDRAPFAKQIANVIATRSDPSSLVIGLYGPWGDGKTSTFAMIKECLAGHANTIPMDYNPWFYGANAEAITKSFFNSIKEKLEESGWFSRENIGSILNNYGGGIPYAGKALENVGKTLTTEALTKTRDKVGAILREHGKKIVIFIDDIDRLDRQDIQTLFKLVRLSGGFDHTTYVLAFDDAVVAEALGEAYGSGDPVAGRRFLEKIVQVPLHLPAPSPETLRRLMFSACDRVIAANGLELDDSDSSKVGNALASGFAYALKTPRQVKLFDNAIAFAVPLLKQEVRVADQLLIEAIRVFYPSVYEAIRKNPSHLMRSRQGRDRDAPQPTPIEVAVEALPGGQAEKRAIGELIAELFPRHSPFGYGSEFEAEWARDKRICSRDYFNRYFTYTVPKGDMADIAVSNLVDRAAADDQQAVDAAFDLAIERQSFEPLLRKLWAQEHELSTGAIRPLTVALARRAAQLPVTGDIFLGDYSIRQAAQLISNLAQRLEAAPQSALLLEVVEQTSSLRFVPEVINVARLREEQGRGNQGYLEPERIVPLVEALLQRLKNLSAASNVFEATDNRPSIILYCIETNGSEAVKQELRTFISDTLDNDPLNAVKFLRAFASRTQSGGPIQIGSLSRRTYDGLADLLPLERVFQRLSELYGDDLGSDQWPEEEEEEGMGDTDRRLARQFAYLHIHPAEPDPLHAHSFDEV